MKSELSKDFPSKGNKSNNTRKEHPRAPAKFNTEPVVVSDIWVVDVEIDQ